MPTAATSVAPTRMPTICARAGPLKAKSTAITTAAYIARPPRRGIGLRWTLRGPGRSTIPTRNASARTGTTSTNDANSAIKKASRPAAMQPRLSGEPNPARLERPVLHLILAGSRARLPSRTENGCPTQHEHDTAILVLRQSLERQLVLCESALGEHASENTLHFLFVAGGVVPVDSALEALAEEHFGLPSEKFFGEGVVSDAVERAGWH